MKKTRLITALSLVILLLSFRPEESRSEGQPSLMQITSQSSFIVEATFEKEVDHPLTMHGPVFSFYARNAKKGNLSPGTILAFGSFNGEAGSLWRLYLGDARVVRVDLSHPVAPPVYPIIYAVQMQAQQKARTMASASSAPSVLQENYANVLAVAREPISLDSGVTSFLRNALYSSDRESRLFALQELQQVPAKKVLTTSDAQKLADILKEERKSNEGRPERYLALKLLAGSGELAVPHIPAILEELNGQRGQYSPILIAKILGSQPPNASITQLNRKFNETNPYTLANTASVVRILGRHERGQPPTLCDQTLLLNIERGLNNKYTFVRQEHILALGDLGCPSSADVLISFYSRANPEEKIRILYGLNRINTPEARAFIQWARVNEPEEQARQFAETLIANPGSRFFEIMEHQMD